MVSDEDDNDDDTEALLAELEQIKKKEPRKNSE